MAKIATAMTDAPTVFGFKSVVLLQLRGVVNKGAWGSTGCG